MTKKTLGQVKKILPLIGIAIFIYLVYALDIEKIIDELLSINPIFIVLSLMLPLPRLIIRNYAWQLIQKEQKIKLSFLQSLKILYIGSFYGSVTPGYMGQLLKIPYMKEKTEEPYGKLFVNLIIELTLHSLVLYGLIFIGALLVIGTFSELIIIIVAWIIILAIVLLYFIKKERGEKLFTTLIKYFIPKKSKDKFYRFVKTFYMDFPRINKLIPPAIIDIFAWIIILSQYYIIVLAMGLNIPYLYFILLFPVALVVSSIPISFAGLGTRELTAIVLFSTLFEVSEAEIFVVSLLGTTIYMMCTDLVGFIFSLSEIRSKNNIIV